MGYCRIGLESLPIVKEMDFGFLGVSDFLGLRALGASYFLSCSFKLCQLSSSQVSRCVGAAVVLLLTSLVCLKLCATCSVQHVNLDQTQSLKQLKASALNLKYFRRSLYCFGQLFRTGSCNAFNALVA